MDYNPDKGSLSAYLAIYISILGKIKAPRLILNHHRTTKREFQNFIHFEFTESFKFYRQTVAKQNSGGNGDVSATYSFPGPCSVTDVAVATSRRVPKLSYSLRTRERILFHQSEIAYRN